MKLLDFNALYSLGRAYLPQTSVAADAMTVIVAAKYYSLVKYTTARSRRIEGSGVYVRPVGTTQRRSRRRRPLPDTRGW